jgi:hypothetical protein
VAVLVFVMVLVIEQVEPVGPAVVVLVPELVSLDLWDYFER